MNYLLVALAVLVGCLVPLQGAINSRLGTVTGQPLLATLISFSGGLVAIALAVVITTRGLPKWTAVGPTPFYLFLGGLPGVAFVLTTLWLAPKIGIAVTLCGLIVGQLSMSIAFDQFGWLGLPVKEITVQRIVGVAFLIAGTLLVVRGGKEPVGHRSPAAETNAAE